MSRPGRFWHDQNAARQLLRDMPRNNWATGDTHHLDAAAAAEAAETATRTNFLTAICGDPNSELARTLKWLDILDRAHASGAKRLLVLDPKSESSPAVTVDVALTRFAVRMDLLDLLAPSLRDPALVDQAQTHLQKLAIHAMAHHER